MTALAALLLFAAASSASMSPWLALAAVWAALIVVVLAGIDAYRTSLERGTAPADVVIAHVQKGRVIRVRKKETS